MQNLCPWNSPSYYLISDNTPPYLLYSHGIALFFALIFGIILFWQNRNLLSSVFLFVTGTFSLWTLFDVVQWATNRPDVLLFFWSINILLETLVYAGALYLSYVFIGKKDLSILLKALIILPIIPLLLLLTTNKLLPGVDIGTCNAIESSFIVIYSYVYQALVILGIGIVTARLLVKYKNSIRPSETLVFVSGVIIFLLAFSSGNIIGSITGDWRIAQFGLFGMPLFIGFLVYAIIRYESFNTKMFGAQILVISLGILVFSLIFVTSPERMRIIAFATFVVVCIVGFILVKSVRREINQKNRLQQLSEQLEKSNLDLAGANDKLKDIDKLKTEFLSLASHQLRSPLTAIKGYASMLTEGSFGELGKQQDLAVKRIYTSAQGLVSIVEDLLNVSKIEQGGMKYEFMPTEVGKLVVDLYNEMTIPAQSKGLILALDVSRYEKFIVNADPTKLKQVFLNLADNSIKYTPKGFVKLSLRHEGPNVVFAVSDNGIGISPETLGKLFEKFSRGEGGKLNTGGSGLGLYLAREIARAHKGDILIESEGLGKGSTFKVVIPAVASQAPGSVIAS